MATSEKTQQKWNFKPIIGLTLVSFVICGLFYPLFITGIGQAIFPQQANGDIIKLNGKAVGSELISQNFTLPFFFHSRNESALPSASGVDPHITLEEAYSQVPSVSNASGIPAGTLTNIVDQNKEGTFWIFGSPYVNVLKINLELIQNFPSVYSEFQ